MAQAPKKKTSRKKKIDKADLQLTNQGITLRLSGSFALGVLACLSMPPFHAWAFAIILPAILCRFWQRLSPRYALFSGWLYGAGLYAAGASWVYNSISHFSGAAIWLSILITVLFVCLLGFFYGVAAWLFRRYFEVKNSLIILMVLPALWLAAEWVLGHLFTGFPWLLIGYSQLTSPLHVFAPIVGVYGLSYLTVLLSAILVILTQRHRTKVYWSTWGLLAVIVLASTLVKHHTWTHASNKPQSVALVQANIIPDMKWSASHLTNTLDTYQQLSAPLWADNNLVVWPESAIPDTLDDMQSWIDQLNGLVTSHGSHLITGIITTDDYENSFNSALLLPYHSEKQRYIYRKRHLVPFGEYFPMQGILGKVYHHIHVPMSGLTPGPWRQPLLKYSYWRIAPYICYEIAYPQEVVETMDGANLIVVISDDSWFGRSLADFQHLGITQMRALETGRYILFSNNSGPSAIVDPNGKVTHISLAHQTAVVRGMVSPMVGETPFMRFGEGPVEFWSFFMIVGALFYQVVRNQRLGPKKRKKPSK